MGYLPISFKLKRYKKKICFILVLAFYFLLSSPLFCLEKDLKIHFIDVGEGDAILIQTPQGKTILIDTANPVTAFRVIEYLKNIGIQELECLILTHPHLDHIGGAFSILQSVKVNNIYDNNQDLTEISQAIDTYRWYKELLSGFKNYNTLNIGNKIKIDGLTLDVLWPPQQLIFSDFNSNSIVVMLRYKDFKCLLTGDLTSQAEKEVIKQGLDLKADVLKVGHHAAQDASSLEFLSVVSPKISIISVNKNNIRGYPSKKILQRLKALPSTVYSTSINGNIIMKVNEEGKIEILTFPLQ
jgi:beta-lactamase superfamily II metal-dependent hydrolase